MAAAITAAELAAAAGDVPVGAVVLDATGATVATGWNEREVTADPTAHAEVLALREAAHQTGRWNLTGHTLVVTLEPCPMCAGAILAARVTRVVYGATDPKGGAAGSLWDLLRDSRTNHTVEVIPEIEADRCAALLQNFFTAKRS